MSVCVIDNREKECVVLFVVKSEFKKHTRERDEVREWGRREEGE